MGEAARRKKLNKNYGKYDNASNFRGLKQKTEAVISRIQDISDNFRHLDNLNFRKDLVQIYYETDPLIIKELLSKWQEDREILSLKIKKEIDNYFQHYHPSTKTDIADLMLFYVLKVYTDASMSERGIGERMYFLYFSGNAILKALKDYSDCKMWQQCTSLLSESMSLGIQTENLPKLINFNETIQNKYPQLRADKIEYCYRSSVPITRVMDA